MNALDPLFTVLNGAWVLGSALLQPWAWCAVLLIVSGAWLAQIEIDEADRRSFKPLVGRH